MIKKLTLGCVSLLLFFIFIFLIILSSRGIETNRFNKIISERIVKTKNIDIKFNTIKFKLEPKTLSLFLETSKPTINYKNNIIPSQNVKVYVDFLSLIKANLHIKKIKLNFGELDIIELQKFSSIIKPSNFKSFLYNNVSEGKLISEIELFLNENGNLNTFITKGQIKNLKAKIINGLSVSKVDLSFFADKDDILIKNISGSIDDVLISNGDIKIDLNEGIKLNSNFNSVVNLNVNNLDKYSRFLEKFNFDQKVKSLEGNFINIIFIEFDNTYKIKDYNYKLSGKINGGELDLIQPINIEILNQEIEKLFFSEFSVDMNFSPKKYKFIGDGKYSLNNLDFLKFKLENDFSDDLLNLNLDLEYKDSIEIDLINYKKNNDSVANFFLDLEKNKNKIKIKKINYNEDGNTIQINGLSFENGKFISFNGADVSTMNNNFIIKNGKKISVKGNKYDASKLTKFFTNQNNQNRFENVNSDIEIDFKNIKVPMSEKLENFKLIGEIKKGKFVKILSKGDFGGNNYLDITLKKDKNTDKKYLEIYSDLTRPLLSDYSFFDGLSGGKLLFSSLIDNSKSNSKLKIENFSVINAPGVIKLLSLADLRGLEDLAKGDGISFDLLEINFEKSKNFLEINELLALGPSMSVLMEGYQDAKGVTSLRGTLVPAKTLNRIISKIPVIGNIVIPKEVGEGLFGVSFKMKGPKGKIKTSINPIRTLTPRFIQKILDKKKQRAK